MSCYIYSSIFCSFIHYLRKYHILKLPKDFVSTLYSTFNHKTQMNTTSLKNYFKVLQLNANGIRNKTDKIQLLIKNTQADIITIQETKLNQFHKTPNIPHFIPIRTNCTHHSN